MAEPTESGTSALLKLLNELQTDGSAGGTGVPLDQSGGPTTGLGQADETEPEPEVGSSSQAAAGTEPLLDYLLGP